MGIGAAIFLGFLGFIANVVGSVMNYSEQENANKKNEELLRESWQRDDTATQRTKDDVEAAGFSPLAAIGNNLGNTNPVQMTAPQLDTSGMSNSLNKTAEMAMMKNQQEQIAEQTRGMKLDNDLKEQEFDLNLMNMADEVEQQRKQNDITEAEYIAKIQELKANGLSEDYANYLMSERESVKGGKSSEGIDANKSIVAEINNKNAGTKKTLSEKELTDLQQTAQKAANNAGIEYREGIPYDKRTGKELEELDAKTALEKVENNIKEYEKIIKKNEAEWADKTITMKFPKSYARSSTGGIVMNYETITGKPAEILAKAGILLQNFEEWATWNNIEQDSDIVKALRPWLNMLNPASSIMNNIGNARK